MVLCDVVYQIKVIILNFIVIKNLSKPYNLWMVIITHKVKSESTFAFIS